MDRRDMTISAWRQQLQSGEVSSRELVDQHLKRLESSEPSLNAFVEVTAEKARAEALRIDEARAAGKELGRLYMIDFGVATSFRDPATRKHLPPPVDAVTLPPVAVSSSSSSSSSTHKGLVGNGLGGACRE